MPEAQQWFYQGLAAFHCFWEYEALRAFDQAVRLDSDCAMCHWGLSQALNFGGKQDQAKTELAKAKDPSAKVSDREQRIIRAFADSADWFTPYGLGTWGDGHFSSWARRGTSKHARYINVAVSKQGNHLFLVDQKQAHYIDCNDLTLPFGPEFVSDIVNRTHTAQDQTQCYWPPNS